MRAAGKIHFSPRFKIFIVLHRMKRGQGGRGKSGFLHARVCGCTRSKGGEREKEAENAVELPSKSETRIISFSTNNNERGSSRQSGVLCYAPVFNYTSPKTPSALLLRHTSPFLSLIESDTFPFREIVRHRIGSVEKESSIQ